MYQSHERKKAGTKVMDAQLRVIYERKIGGFLNNGKQK